MSEVVLVEHQDRWAAQFAEARDRLATLLHGLDAVIEHIGSTAVPGLLAKPVLDIMLGVAALGEVEARIPALVGAGYRYRPEHEAQLPQRRYFVRPADGLPRIHLHAVVVDGTLWREHLAFRDALRADPDLARRYADLKRQLAARHAGDKAAYTASKAPFIAGVLQGARPR